jgi:hypothetical protein
LLDGEKNKPPARLFRLASWIGGCRHVASLVARRTEIGRPLVPRGQP